MHFFSIVVSALLFTASTTLAAPIAPESSSIAAQTTHTSAPAKSLIVIRPKVTAPKTNDVWFVGSTQTVTWETNAIPDEKKMSTGKLYLARPTHESENLDINHPLATDFPIMDGQVKIVVPNVAAKWKGARHSVVLFGDSGNLSQEFTIVDSPPTTPKPHRA